MAQSKARIDKLGERLRSGEPTEADLRELDAYRRSFCPAYEEVVRRIRTELSIEPSGRPEKIARSLIEKLRRESIRLSQMQDIAGCRIVVSTLQRGATVWLSRRQACRTTAAGAAAGKATAARVLPDAASTRRCPDATSVTRHHTPSVRPATRTAAAFRLRRALGRSRSVRIERFAEADRRQAQAARLNLELDLARQGIDHEVVLLDARDEAALRRTHARYFENLEEILARFQRNTGVRAVRERKDL